jgi:hypothetical protein
MYATLADFYSLETSVRKTLTVATAAAEKTIQEKRNIMSQDVYEAPAMLKVGGFDELTNATRRGYWVDFLGGWWF